MFTPNASHITVGGLYTVILLLFCIITFYWYFINIWDLFFFLLNYIELPGLGCLLHHQIIVRYHFYFTLYVCVYYNDVIVPYIGTCTRSHGRRVVGAGCIPI